jgi:hypothetical protein
LKITTREINGVHAPKEKRYIEVLFEDRNTTVDCGFLDHKERIDFAEHLKDVVDDLLYEMDDTE